ncbi:hypothetical protein SBADM41S_00234 [Streptomyces badius]
MSGQIRPDHSKTGWRVWPCPGHRHRDSVRLRSPRPGMRPYPRLRMPLPQGCTASFSPRKAERLHRRWSVRCGRWGPRSASPNRGTGGDRTRTRSPRAGLVPHQQLSDSTGEQPARRSSRLSLTGLRDRCTTDRSVPLDRGTGLPWRRPLRDGHQLARPGSSAGPRGRRMLAWRRPASTTQERAITLCKRVTPPGCPAVIRAPLATAAAVRAFAVAVTVLVLDETLARAQAGAALVAGRELSSAAPGRRGRPPGAPPR